MSHFFGSTTKPARPIPNELAFLRAPFDHNYRTGILQELIHRVNVSSATLLSHTWAPRVSLCVELVVDTPFIPAGTLCIQCPSRYMRFGIFLKECSRRMQIRGPYRTGQVLKSVRFSGPGSPSYADLVAAVGVAGSGDAPNALKSDAAGSYWSANTILTQLISVAAAHTEYCDMSRIKPFETMLAREIRAAGDTFPWATPAQLRQFAADVVLMKAHFLKMVSISEEMLQESLGEAILNDEASRHAANQEWDAARERWEDTAEVGPMREYLCAQMTESSKRHKEAATAVAEAKKKCEAAENVHAKAAAAVLVANAAAEDSGQELLVQKRAETARLESRLAVLRYLQRLRELTRARERFTVLVHESTAAARRVLNFSGSDSTWTSI